MSKYTLKCAKPDDKDFDAFTKLMVLENLFDNRYWSNHEDEWREWSDDDEDREELLDCEADIRDMNDLDKDEEVDNDLILLEYVRRLFRKHSSAFRRVEMAAQMGIDNCFDPDKDYIDWRPDIQNAINYYNNHTEEVDKWCKENILPEEEEDCKVYTVNNIFCQRHGYTQDGNKYTLDTDECTIIYDFDEYSLVVRSKQNGPKSVKLCASDYNNRLNLFQLREILRMFKCTNTLNMAETKWS